MTEQVTESSLHRRDRIEVVLHAFLDEARRELPPQVVDVPVLDLRALAADRADAWLLANGFAARATIVSDLALVPALLEGRVAVSG